MKLTELDLKGYGHFEEDQPASFTLDTLNLPAPWEYIYQNRRLLLKVDQYGPVYTQVDPPSDIVLFRREPFGAYSPWLVWLRSEAFRAGPFTNFFRPNFAADPAAAPEKTVVTYSPAKATYAIEQDGVRCVTELFLPADEPAACMTVTLTNTRNRPIRLTAVPALRPYVNPAVLAPWDKPEWYLQTAFCKDKQPGFLVRLFNMNSDPAKRRCAVLWSAGEGLAGAEISHEKFAGMGSFDRPQAVYEGKLRLAPYDAKAWGAFEETNSICGYPPVCALQYEMELRPDEPWPWSR